MSSFQKVIKYCALAFAVLLAIGIVSGIANVAFAIVSSVSGGFVFNKNDDKFFNNDNNFNSDYEMNGKTIDFSETFTDVKSLDINNSTGELKIMIGETFKVEAENVSENFKAEVSGNGELTITENNYNNHFLWFNIDGFNSPNSKVIVYVPANFVAEDAKIESGAGSVSLEGLNAEYLFISAGAGNINGSNIVAEEVKVDGGVGTVNLTNVNFTDADFNCGVGNLNIEGVLLGDNKFDCGVGGVNLDLKGNVDDYSLSVDSGVGRVRLNGEKISDSHNTKSNADNSIKVDGGVGDVKINIEE